MLMTMLDSGGLRATEGSAPGSYELPALDLDDLRGRVLAGRSVKLLDWTLHAALPHVATGWRLIWLSRSAVEQATSQVKFMSILVPNLPLTANAAEVLARSFRDDHPKALKSLGAYGPVLLLDYEKILAEPHREALKIAAFLAPEFDLDAAAMSAVVHERDGRCRPDLAVELGLLHG